MFKQFSQFKPFTGFCKTSTTPGVINFFVSNQGNRFVSNQGNYFIGRL